MLPSAVEGSNCRFQSPVPGIVERSKEGKLISDKAADLLEDSLADCLGAVASWLWMDYCC